MSSVMSMTVSGSLHGPSAAGAACSGNQILHCDRAGLYATYILPSATATPTGGGAFDVTLPFLASTWDPYNVVAFTAAVHVAPKP